MKEKLFGLNKDEVNRLLKKKEREYQFQLEKLEFEWMTAKKENECLMNQMEEEEKKQLSKSLHDPYWKLVGTRTKTVLCMLTNQKEREITLLRESSDEKITMLQQEILQLNEEIKSMNQTIKQFWNSVKKLDHIH
jgi:uncharacterized protein YhaN